MFNLFVVPGTVRFVKQDVTEEVEEIAEVLEEVAEAVKEVAEEVEEVEKEMEEEDCEASFTENDMTTNDNARSFQFMEEEEEEEVRETINRGWDDILYDVTTDTEETMIEENVQKDFSINGKC